MMPHFALHRVHPLRRIVDLPCPAATAALLVPRLASNHAMSARSGWRPRVLASSTTVSTPSNGIPVWMVRNFRHGDCHCFQSHFLSIPHVQKPFSFSVASPYPLSTDISGADADGSGASPRMARTSFTVRTPASQKLCLDLQLRNLIRSIQFVEDELEFTPSQLLREQIPSQVLRQQFRQRYNRATKRFVC